MNRRMKESLIGDLHLLTNNCHDAHLNLTEHAVVFLFFYYELHNCFYFDILS